MGSNKSNNLGCVIKHATDLVKMNDFGLSIIEHQKHISENSHFNKNHLKKIFKQCRFDIVNKILLIHFTEKKPTIKKLKESVIKEGRISLNSLTTFIDYLHFYKYITFEKNKDDRRGLVFHPTTELFKLMDELLRSFVIPYTNLTNKTMPEIDLKKYYTNYKNLLSCGLKPIKENQQLYVFIDHDSGYAIILKIYTEYLNNKFYFFNLSQSELARLTGTSRSHIKTILSNAYKNGILINKDNKITLSNSFKHACELHFGIHMSIISFCLEI